jgi:hypothetical protein
MVEVVFLKIRQILFISPTAAYSGVNDVTLFHYPVTFFPKEYSNFI